MSDLIDRTHAHLTRQLELIPLDVLSTPITIVGAGAVGGSATMCLAKMGFTDLTVWDPDRVEIENFNCQWYGRADIGKLKVEALDAQITYQTNHPLRTYAERFRGTPSGIVVSAVDSMASRAEIWERAENAVGVKIFIDVRMSAEQLAIYAMRPMVPRDREAYVKTLHGDDTAHHERCTAKATMYTAMLAGGYVGKVVKDYLTTGRYPRITTWHIGGNDLTCWSNE